MLLPPPAPAQTLLRGPGLSPGEGTPTHGEHGQQGDGHLSSGANQEGPPVAIFTRRSGETIAYAAEELRKYLGLMAGDPEAAA